jgi:arylsulfatase A-like enzyme
MKNVLRALVVASWLGCLFAVVPAVVAAPNIVYILCDDLGYGDPQCLNPKRGKIATPHMDRLAAEGMTFTDCHSGSSVCTPTRYGILTGRYSWRTSLQNFVLLGDGPPLIAPQRATVAGLLKQHGYATAAIGKWHLGLQFADNRTFAEPISDGPRQHGFDYYFGISASLDMPPYAFIENERFTEPLTTEKQWVRSGPAAASFEAVDVLPTLTRKTEEYIAAQGAKKQPFFLYLPLASPHTPIVPSPEWQGKSGIGDYGDFVMQTDATVGRVLAALDKAGIGDDTIVVLTSDNGCSPAAGIPKLQEQGHYPNGDLRGHKADIWDGGHRIPFLVRWPARVKAGGRYDSTICLTDLMATCAELVGEKLPDDAGEDSVSFLPALLGKSAPPRPAVVHHSVSGVFAIREGRWKLEFCRSSGGWSVPREPEAAKKGLPYLQLYDMTADLAEQNNVASAEPEVVERLTKLLEKFVADGRSTPGAKQANDVDVDIWKRDLATAKKPAKK